MKNEIVQDMLKKILDVKPSQEEIADLVDSINDHFCTVEETIINGRTALIFG